MDNMMKDFSQNFFRRLAFKRLALVIGSLSIGALIITLSYVPSRLKYKPMSLQQLPYVETKGRQPIKAGCVNLYGSDWAEYPDTRAVVVCNQATNGFQEAQINDIGFSRDSENHGISYVETGANAWVTLYTQNDYGGDSLVINPNSKVWLQQVSINGGSEKWNDRVMSVYYQGHTGAASYVQTHGK